MYNSTSNIHVIMFYFLWFYKIYIYPNLAIRNQGYVIGIRLNIWLPKMSLE